MAMYSAHEGLPKDFQVVHFGARARGGAGLRSAIRYGPDSRQRAG